MNLIFFKFIKSGLSIYAPYTHTPGYKLSSAQHAQIMQTVIIFFFFNTPGGQDLRGYKQKSYNQYVGLCDVVS